MSHAVSVSWLNQCLNDTMLEAPSLNKQDHQNAEYLNHIILTVCRFGFFKVQFHDLLFY